MIGSVKLYSFLLPSPITRAVNILKPSTVVLLHFCRVCFCFLGQVLGFFCRSCFAMCITSEKKNCFPSLHYSCTQNPAGSDTSVTSIPPVTDRTCPINPKRHNSRKQTHTVSAWCRNELEQKKIKPSFFLQAISIATC